MEMYIVCDLIENEIFLDIPGLQDNHFVSLSYSREISLSGWPLILEFFEFLEKSWNFFMVLEFLEKSWNFF